MNVFFASNFQLVSSFPYDSLTAGHQPFAGHQSFTQFFSKRLNFACQIFAGKILSFQPHPIADGQDYSFYPSFFQRGMWKRLRSRVPALAWKQLGPKQYTYINTALTMHAHTHFIVRKLSGLKRTLSRIWRVRSEGQRNSVLFNLYKCSWKNHK